MRLYGTSSDPADHRILAVDIDYHAKSADGCHGAFTGTVKAFWGTGT